MSRDEIIAANPFPDFLRKRGAELKPAGENFVTSACPRTEHKPWHRCNTITTAKNLFHCNDCNVGGSIIDWIATEQNIDPVEAMRRFGGGPNGSKPQRNSVKTYDYTDEKGDLLFQCVRYQPKDFRQRRPAFPNGQLSWIWNMQGVVACSIT